MRTDFKSELTGLINKYSIDNKTNTPDFILAKYVQCCIDAYEIAVKEASEHKGK